MRLRLRLQQVLLTVLTAVCVLASAAGLQVSPVSLTLQPLQNADGLWLSNTGDTLVNAQIRVFHWTQETGEDKLEPSRALIVSPPILQLPSGARQLIRVIRVGAPSSGANMAEDSYRIIVDELPVAASASASGERKGLRFVLRYSIPIFVAPGGEAASPPQLRWTLRKDASNTVLEVVNSGGTHAQLADLNFTDATGRRTKVHEGLLGYVLPGAEMRWTLKPSLALFTSAGAWEAMINGTITQQSVRAIDLPR